MATKSRTTLPAPITFNRRLRALNPEQRAAVDAIDGVVMVIAGPGTGKTELLAMRVANIIRQTQLDPWNVLCLTFTEAGTAAMRARLASIMGPAGYRVAVHTFHSFCHRVIQDWPEKFSFARELEAITDVERIELFQALIQKLPGTSRLKPYGNPLLFLDDTASAIQKLKQEHITPDHLQKIIKQTKQFVTAHEELIQNFCAVPARDRTDAQCTAVVKQLQQNQPAYPSLAFHFTYLAKRQHQLTDTLAAADGSRAAQAARTKFKNDVKRWFEGTKNQLPKQAELVKVYRAYQAALRERGRYDFEDMIIAVVDAFESDDQLLAHYQEQYQYVLADEYQDTNSAQNELLFALASHHEEPNLFVVGDDKQSIYRFQGASLANLLTFYERFRDDVEVITLTHNYRSHQTILDAASALIDNNQQSLATHVPGVSSKLRAAANQSSVPINLHTYPTPAAERSGIAAAIADLVAQGTKPSHIAVLCRRNRDVAELVSVLRARGLPTQRPSTDNMLNDPAVRQLLNLCRYLTGDQSDEALWLILQAPWTNLPPLDVVKIQQAARQQRLPLYRIMQNPAQLASAGVTALDAVRQLVAHLARWQRLSANEPLPNVLADLLHESGFLTHFSSVFPSPSQGEGSGVRVSGNPRPEVLRAANTLYQEARQLTRHKPTITLREFLHHLNLIREHNLSLTVSVPTVADAVLVMTVHQAKGLEFEHVFIPHINDRTWGAARRPAKVPLPHGLISHEPTDGETLEEERRLFYVALTRAKVQLTLTSAATSDTGRPALPSQFLAELPPAALQQRAISPLPDASLTAVPKPIHHPDDQTLRDHLTALLEHHVLAVTHLNNYLRCPRLFYYRNLLRVPSVKTKHMAFGTAVHAALRDYFSSLPLSKGEEGRGYSSTKGQHYLLQRFEQHLEREWLPEAEFNDSLDRGRDILAKYYQHYRAKWPTNVLLEYNFAPHRVVLPLTGGRQRGLSGIPITGLLDKAEILDDKTKTINVVDYKTGNPDNKRAELKPGGEYHRQLVFYKLLCDNSPRFDYHFQSGEIDFVQPDRRGRFVKKKFTITDQDTKQLTDQIQSVWQDINNLKFLDPELACGECEYCQLTA